MSGLYTLGQRRVVAPLAEDRFTSPDYVIVNPHLAPSSRYQNPVRVVVTGGKRYLSYFGDPKTTAYNHPSRVDITLAGGKVITAANPEFVLIQGGDAHFIGAVVGTWSDGVTDYDYGETKVIELVQFFNALGRPKDFEADVERVYAAYQKAKVVDIGYNKLGRWMNASAMKQVGADAAVLMDTIRASGAHGDGTVAASSKVPSQIDNPVYTPGKDTPTSWLSWVPWWGWGLLATGVLGVAAVYAVPPIMSAVAARRLVK